MTGYEQFQQIMAEINYKKNMEKASKNNNFQSVPSEFEQLFRHFKH